MKVYVVLNNDEGDITISGVFSSMDNADLFREITKNPRFDDYRVDSYVETYETDKHIALLKQGLFPVTVRTKKGEEPEIREFGRTLLTANCSCEERISFYGDYTYLYLWVTDEQTGLNRAREITEALKDYPDRQKGIRPLKDVIGD